MSAERKKIETAIFQTEEILKITTADIVKEKNTAKTNNLFSVLFCASMLAYPFFRELFNPYAYSILILTSFSLLYLRLRLYAKILRCTLEISGYQTLVSILNGELEKLNTTEYANLVRETTTTRNTEEVSKL